MALTGCSGKEVAELPDAAPPAIDAGAPDAHGASDAGAVDARPIDAPAPPDARPIDATPPPPPDARPIDAVPIDAPPPRPDAMILAIDTTITSAPPPIVATGAAAIAFTSNTPGSTFECSLDGGIYILCTTPATYNLPSGTHTFSVYAVGPGGNADPTPASVSWTVMIPGPGVMITSGPPDGGVSGPTATFTYVVVPPQSPVSYQCELDGATFTACPATGETYLALPGGSTHSFCVRALDAQDDAGTPACSTFTIDNSQPGITFVDPTPPEGAIVAPAPQFEFSVSPSEPPTTTYACHFDAEPVFVCSLDTVYTHDTSFATGAHRFTVVATDAGGNSATIVRDVTVDATLPGIAFVPPTPPEGAPVSAAVVFEFHDTPPEPMTTTYQCHYDDEAPFDCAPDRQYAHAPDLTAGPHSFTVVATNLAGDSVTIVRDVEVEPLGIAFTVPPTASEGATVSNEPEFEFHVTADLPRSTTFACEYDDGGFFACAPDEIQQSYLPGGPHAFTVLATDASGFTRAIVRHVIVDETPPNLAFLYPPTPPYDADVGQVNTFEFTVSPAEPASTTYFCQFDDGEQFTGPACAPGVPVKHTNAELGFHYYYVFAEDAFGNVGDIFTEYEAIIPPPLFDSAVCHPEDASGEATCSFHVHHTDADFGCVCGMDSGAQAACTPTGIRCTGSDPDVRCDGTVDLEFTELSAGFHTLHITCSENALTNSTTAPVGIAVGDGHVVLIGTSFASPAMAPATQPAYDSSYLFVNAVTELTAARFFARSIRVLGIARPSVNATEKANALAFLDGTVLGPTRSAWYTEIDTLDAATLDGALPGADVVLIFDQNDAAIGANTSNKFLTSLQRFVIGGGVVVSLNGRSGSTSFGIIGNVPGHTKCLLDVTGATPVEPSARQGSCVADQLDAYAAGPYLAAGATLQFAGDSREPAICDTQAADARNVFHKIIARGCSDGKGNTVDAIYGDDTIATGSCYLPYRTLTSALADAPSERLDVMPGVYSAETSPLVVNGQNVDGDRRYDGQIAHNLERFRGDGCFPVEVHASVELETSGVWNGIKLIVPPSTTGIVAGTNARVTSDTIQKGTIGIDLVDGTNAQIVNDVIVSNASVGIHTTQLSSGAVVRNSVFAGNLTGVFIEAGPATDFGHEGDPGMNDFSCNRLADVDIQVNDPDAPPEIHIEGNTWDDFTPTQSNACTDGIDLCSNADVAFTTFVDYTDGSAIAMCPVVLGCFDNDGDGFGENCPAGPDCDDSDPNIHPFAAEVCGNGKDDDCDPSTPDTCAVAPCVDNDHDGYVTAGVPGCDAPGPFDCNDVDPAIHPGAVELCDNGFDDDCNPATPDECVNPCVAAGTCGSGCSDGTREGYQQVEADGLTLVHPLIAGCSGGWSVPGLFNAIAPQCGRVSGNDSNNPTGDGCAASDLCSLGWHVCLRPVEVADKGGSCADAETVPDLFFATRQSGSGCGTCATGVDPTVMCGGFDCNTACYQTSTQTNDVFGCGGVGIGDGDDSSCGVLDKFGEDGCSSLQPSGSVRDSVWDCHTSDGDNEALVVVKHTSDFGGVLCCKD